MRKKQPRVFFLWRTSDTGRSIIAKVMLSSYVLHLHFVGMLVLLNQIHMTSITSVCFQILKFIIYALEIVGAFFLIRY